MCTISSEIIPQRNHMSLYNNSVQSIIFMTLFILMLTMPLLGQPTMNATRLSDDSPIILDGFLDEEIWKISQKATNFIQFTPVDGGVPSQPTEASIAFDDQYLWVGVMAYEQNPDSIVAPIFRRDGSFSSDWIYVNIDSYNDKRTAFTFAVNPRGVQKDVLYYDDTQEDILWDAVWEAEAVILSNGWSVEMKIPLSQIRYDAKKTNQLWGLNFQRRIARNSEINFWAPISRSKGGMVSRFGSLFGISRLNKFNRLEITPYASVTNIKEQKTGDNPYYTPNNISQSFGGDIKYGITSDLTLTATINPDFGQVEADPATINLSAFEIYFPERRPFFLEGSDIFRFGQTQTDFTAGTPNTFYSRRIGRPPSGSLRGYNAFSGFSIFDSYADVQVYQDRPSQTRIAGAVKLSGKTRNGWSFGVLDAVTRAEEADYTVRIENGSGQSEGTYPIEPFANYFVSRVKKDFNEGNTIVGGYLSSVNRSVEITYFEQLMANSSYLVGTDWEHSWSNRQWIASGSVSYSRVNGDESFITSLQQSPARYYQRVDGRSFSVDESATYLEGFAGEWSLNKASGEHWTGSLTYSMVTPGYETNEIGFQTRADYKALAAAIRYAEAAPSIGRYFQAWHYYLVGWNFDGDVGNQGSKMGFYWMFDNQWALNVNANANYGQVTDRLSRGGPIMLYNNDLGVNVNLITNQSKVWSVQVGQYQRRDVAEEYDSYYWLDFNWRPRSNIQMVFGPELSYELDQDQYVATITRRQIDPDANQTYGYRYIFATNKSSSLSANIRLNWTFSQNMTLETYLRPYVQSARFSEFGELKKERTFDFDIYGVDEGDLEDLGAGLYQVSYGSEEPTSFRFYRPDFTYTALQGSAVYRWEYRPGSTLFFVWQQQRDGVMGNGLMDISRDFGEMLDQKPVNIFLIKLNYWFGV